MVGEIQKKQTILHRTDGALERAGGAKSKTSDALDRTGVAFQRTDGALERTGGAKGRTSVALQRTGGILERCIAEDWRYTGEDWGCKRQD